MSGAEGARFLPVRPTAAEPETGTPPPERVLSGDPRFTTWNVEDAGRGLYAGIWEATPGKWRIAYDEWEFCHIVSGISVITEDGGTARTVTTGDSFVLRPGFAGTWEVVETTRKEYVIRL